MYKTQKNYETASKDFQMQHLLEKDQRVHRSTWRAKKKRRRKDNVYNSEHLE